MAKKASRVTRWLCFSLHTVLFPAIHMRQVITTPSPLVLCVPLVCKWLLRSLPEEPKNLRGSRGRAWHGPQKLVSVGWDLTQHPLQDTFSFTSSKATHPVFLGAGEWGWGAEKHHILLYPSVRIAETRQFSSRMNLDMQTWRLCMFMFAEKHLCSGARHSNPHPVTMRKLVMRIALHFCRRESCKLLLLLS